MAARHVVARPGGRHPTTFDAVPGVGYVDLERVDPARYTNIVFPFFTAALQRIG